MSIEHVVHFPRAAGKTTRAVEMLKANPRAVLVYRTQQQRDLFRRTYPHLVDRILCVGDLKNWKSSGRDMMDVILEDAEIILHEALGDSANVRIWAITVSATTGFRAEYAPWMNPPQPAVSSIPAEHPRRANGKR